MNLKWKIKNVKLGGLILVAFSIFTFYIVPTAHADDPPPPTCAELKGVAGINCRYQRVFDRAGFTTDIIQGAEGNPIALRVGVIARTLLSLVGIAFLIITVYSGIQWMTAGGNEETVKKALTRLRNAAIGLVIVVGAWVITNFVLDSALRREIGPPDTRTFRPFVR